MEFSNQFIDKADAYMASSLSEDEKRAFEASIAEGGEWYAQWQAYRMARESVDLEAELALKSRWKQQYKQQAPATKTIRLGPWLIAATLMMLVGLGIWQLGFRKPQPSQKQLFAQHHANIQLSLGQRGSENTDLQFAKANALVNGQEYEAAIVALQQLLADSSFQRRDFAYLHLGVSFLQTKQYLQAKNALNSVNPESAFRFDAIWYKALLAYDEGEKRSANIYLEQLSKESKTYRERAEELLPNLDP
ncbi:MAG: hypothetical protein AB8F95_18740 [Bacteroidia bacterium]